MRAKFVALLARHLEVEHQVFDVEPQLREGFLNEFKNSAPAADAVDDLRIGLFELAILRFGESGDALAELDQFAGEFASGVIEACGGVHGGCVRVVCNGVGEKQILRRTLTKSNVAPQLLLAQAIAK